MVRESQDQRKEKYQRVKMNKVYGIEIVDDTAYTEQIIRSETAYGKQRNDFEGTKEDCMAYMKSKDIKEVFGILKEKKMTQKEFEELPKDIKEIIPVLKELSKDQIQHVLEIIEFTSNENKNYKKEQNERK